MKVVKLVPAGRRRDPWELELDEDEVRLCDARGDEVLRMPCDQAVRRIQMPGFFMSIKNLHIYDDDQQVLEFVPDKRAMAEIQAYLDQALREDPKARTSLKGAGWTLLLFGILIFVGGAAFLAVE